MIQRLPVYPANHAPKPYRTDRAIIWIYFRHIPTQTKQMEQTTVFKSNRSQAVRLPKAVALPDDIKQVDIVAVGRTRIIAPAGEAWDSWFDGPSVSDDFMTDRNQPAVPKREEF